jgi:hypothetical protein
LADFFILLIKTKEIINKQRIKEAILFGINFIYSSELCKPPKKANTIYNSKENKIQNNITKIFFMVDYNILWVYSE